MPSWIPETGELADPDNIPSASLDPPTKAMDTNRWVKPSTCETGGCVEIFHGRIGDDLVYIRKGTYSAEEWREFVAAVKAGEFDV